MITNVVVYKDPAASGCMYLESTENSDLLLGRTLSAMARWMPEVGALQQAARKVTGNNVIDIADRIIGRPSNGVARKGGGLKSCAVAGGSHSWSVPLAQQSKSPHDIECLLGSVWRLQASKRNAVPGPPRLSGGKHLVQPGNSNHSTSHDALAPRTLLHAMAEPPRVSLHCCSLPSWWLLPKIT